jgi:hypothetical protein
MAGVDDYIAQRAETFDVLQETLEGFSGFDLIGGGGAANILSAAA